MIYLRFWQIPHAMSDVHASHYLLFLHAAKPVSRIDKRIGWMS
jgi:hypothetical protein